jgi:hypothetical protein
METQPADPPPQQPQPTNYTKNAVTMASIGLFTVYLILLLFRHESFPLPTAHSIYSTSIHLGDDHPSKVFERYGIKKRVQTGFFQHDDVVYLVQTVNYAVHGNEAFEGIRGAVAIYRASARDLRAMEHVSSSVFLCGNNGVYACFSRMAIGYCTRIGWTCASAE